MQPHSYQWPESTTDQDRGSHKEFLLIILNSEKQIKNDFIANYLRRVWTAGFWTERILFHLKAEFSVWLDVVIHCIFLLSPRLNNNTEALLHRPVTPVCGAKKGCCVFIPHAPMIPLRVILRKSQWTIASILTTVCLGKKLNHFCSHGHDGIYGGKNRKCCLWMKKCIALK